MSSGSYRQVDVMCPFYKYDIEDKKRIVCEGIVKDSSLAMLFHRKGDYVLQMSVFCCGKYENCEIYRMLMKKYED